MMKEMNVAYATDFAGECLSAEGLYDTLLRVAKAGFSHIHWCHEWSGDYTYSVYEMKQIKEWMNELGLKCKGLHATDGCKWAVLSPNPFHYRYPHHNRRNYTSENEYNRRAGVELIKNRMEMAYVLETDAVVLHMMLPYKSFEQDSSFKEKFYQQVYKSFDELEAYSRESGVRICVENMTGTPNCHQIEQFDRLFSRYEPEYLGFCFDTGHGMISGSDSLELAKRYQQRLYMMHVNDNHGLISEECFEQATEMGKCDEHLNPFKGQVKWEEYAKIVAGSPYKLPIVMEVSKRDANEEEFLRESMETGLKITDMILNYRSGLKN